MKSLVLLLVALTAVAADAQVVVGTSRGVVVANAGEVSLYDSTLKVLWRVSGVAAPSHALADEDRVVVLDNYSNEAHLINLTEGQSTRMRTAETPIAAAWVSRQPFVLARDASVLERLSDRATVALARDAAFLRVARQKLYVYSRLDGLLQEIDPASMSIIRTVTVGASASDVEIDGTTAYVLLPGTKIVTVDLDTFVVGPSIAVGTFPIDIAMVSPASPMTATRLAVADPVTKRVWTIEGSQSTAGAFGRGFLRGLLGLGLFRARGRDFPTAVDRVVNASAAYDSASGTLYAGRAINRVSPTAFAVVGDRVAFFVDGRLQWADHGMPVAQTPRR